MPHQVTDCAQCRSGQPHNLHIAFLPDGSILFTNDDGERVEPPSCEGHLCGICGNQVSFIDPEFGNAFCLDCQWMGVVAA